MTLKDTMNLNCKVWVANIMDYDVVDMINNADRYVITDVDVFENTLNIWVKRIGECNIIRLNEKES